MLSRMTGQNLPVRIVAGRLRSYLDPKHKLCQYTQYITTGLPESQRTSWRGWRMVRIWVLPLLEQILGLTEQSLTTALVYADQCLPALLLPFVVLDP